MRDGLPKPEGTTVSSLAADPDEPGALYAANKRGVFRSSVVGATWERLAVAWPERFRRQRVTGLEITREGRT